MKNTSRKISPTIGTLSGLVTISRKFGSNMPKTKNTARNAEQAVADRVRRDLLALPDQHDERGDREHEEQPRVGDGVEDALDEAHTSPRN